MSFTKEEYTENDKTWRVNFMKEKKIKEGQVLDEENLDEVAGGDTSITYNIENTGNYNVIGNNASYEQMLNYIDKLNGSGKLDYLKKK